ncbi:transporter substrate-binding domain-containing protein [Paenibacillus sp. Soil787]|uniref:transporter substrate-binding domain-containing protein n=1 Tax=Paenibacillus sp. Soil787 TaxID=1736411 RepID=UPI000703B862|nr:transporter substrate-binding domain-containing protein [Paenibacillus sp. Soil787]KRF09917.1 amino acid ABC transporter substrate-binding protein [Paenibacillus sp. Soil787]
MEKQFKLCFMILSLLLTLTCCTTKATGQKQGTASLIPTDTSKPSGKTLDAIKKRGKLVAGVKYDTKLFGLIDPVTGKVEGFDVELAKALAKKIFGDETMVELKEVTSKTRNPILPRSPMLQNGKIDIIIATMTINDERKQQVEFTDDYFKAGQSLLVEKGSPIKGLPDIKKGTKVLAVKRSTSEKKIRDKAPDATVMLYDNYQDAFTALKAGKGEALTTDNAILYGMQQQDPNYQVVGGTFTDEPYAMAVRKGDTDFLTYVNNFLKEIKVNGEYEKMYIKWFGESPSK